MPISLLNSEWKTIDKWVGSYGKIRKRERVIKRSLLIKRVLHRKLNAYECLKQMDCAMMTNDCNFQSSTVIPNGFARLNSSKNFKSNSFVCGHHFSFSFVICLFVLLLLVGVWFCLLFVVYKLIISICSSMFMTPFQLGCSKENEQANDTKNYIDIHLC